ncbi:MAG: D-alanyl-D-alanine carboxypeptidase/D-alanyl-D-alanine-endopeptidase [Acidimicrobiia bacterium]
MRLRGAVLPVLLAAAALGSGGAAAIEEQAARGRADPVGGPAAVTPVLSARRLPEVVAAPVADRRLRADLAAWAASAPGPSCARVVDARGETVLATGADGLLIPASTTKLVTAAAALHVLGAEHRFRTVVRGPVPVDGVVAGDLHLVGGGDPVLATSRYADRFPRQPQLRTDVAALADAVQAAGIRRIEGSVVGDESRYDVERYVPGWPARYLDQNVVGPLSALSVNDSFARHPGDGGDRLEPAPDPAVHAAAVLTILLAERGVEVVGPPRAGVAPDVPELAAIESAPLSEVVDQLLRESDNMVAELLVKELGRATGDPSTAGGTAVVARAIGELGLDTTGLVVADGSGLSTDNRLGCRVLTDLLLHPEVGSTLRAGLAVAGESGTLVEAFEGTSLEGALAAKTGSLNAVSALAGTVTDDDGRLTFAYVANDPDGRIEEDPVRAAQAALGQILLSWPQVPDLDALGPAEPRGP